MPNDTTADGRPEGSSKGFQMVSNCSGNRQASCAPLFGFARLGVSSAMSPGPERPYCEAVAARPLTRGKATRI